MQLVVWVQSDVLPESDTTVLVHMPDADNPVDVGFHDGEGWRDYNGAPLSGKNAVFHWMMLPNPPGEEESAKPRIGAPGFCGGGAPCKGGIEGKGGCIFDCIYNEHF